MLTVSLHADPNNKYPYFCGYADEKGMGLGDGFNLNLPLPKATSDVSYLAALNRALTIVDRFSPDVLLVTHGFDTLAGDPEGGFGLTGGSFESIGRRLRAVGRPLLGVQEEDYLLESLPAALSALLNGLSR